MWGQSPTTAADAEDRYHAGASPWPGRVIFAGVLAVGLAYAVLLAVRLPVFPVEQDGFVSRGLAHFPHPIAAGRALSVACFLAAIVTTARFCTRATADTALGATLALTWIVFPPVVGIAILSAPYGLAMAALSLALSCLWLRPDNTPRADIAGAVAVTVAALTGPLGAWAAIACAFLIINQRPRRWPLFGPAVGAALAMIATGPVAPADLPGIPTTLPSFVAGAALPYALVWAGCVLGLVSSRSKPVQAVLGPRAVVTCRMAPVLYSGLLALQVRHSPATLLIAGALFLPLGLIGSLPLAVWIRRVMPTVRAMAAWIAFPVIMYCGFWLILGPVKHDRFPYAAFPHPADHGLRP